ncbi:MAG: DUF1848 domain-containing protein [Spirochaetota bacterium]
MIVSASRRTDIPCFYGEWFINRLKQGYVLVRNPFSPRTVYRIAMDPSEIDCVVFWTKNPRSILPVLERIDELGIPYYFLFTITPYGPPLERNIPPKNQVIDTFQRLSERIGKHRVIWRYDPVIFTPAMDIDFHVKNFEKIADRLEGYTESCIISFLHLYKKCSKNLRGMGVVDADRETMKKTVGELGRIAKVHCIGLQSCAVDLTEAGVDRGKCIDDRLIERITGTRVSRKKDSSQRPECLCVESVDIGAYHTCMNLCVYCYANHNEQVVKKNAASHHNKSPLLCGSLDKNDHVVHRNL